MRYLIFLCLLALPALAQPFAYPPTTWQGVVQQVTPGGVVIQANGMSLLLPAGLNFNVGGTQVGVGGLNTGMPVTAYLPAGSGQIMGYAQDMLYMQTPMGVVPVPAGQIQGGKAKVSVLKPDGKVVQVPLNAALNMQRSQGAMILGARNAPYIPQGLSPGIILNTSGNWVTASTMQNGVPVLVQIPTNQVNNYIQSWSAPSNGNGNKGNGKNGNGKSGKGQGKGHGKH